MLCSNFHGFIFSDVVVVVGVSVSEDNSVCAKGLSVFIHLFEEQRLLWLYSPISERQTRLQVVHINSVCRVCWD